MSSPQPVGFVEGNVVDLSTRENLVLTGPWQIAYGGSNLRTGLDLRQVETNFGGTVCWRTADVDTNFPNAWNVAGTQRTSANTYSESFSLASETAMWVQAGLYAEVTTGTETKAAFARLWSSVVGAGWIVARQRLVLDPGQSNIIIPIGRPWSSAGVSGLMFAMTYTGISGTLTAPTPQYRTFKGGDFTLPESWQSFAAGSNVTADSKVVDTEAVTTTSSVYAQCGLKYTSTSLTYGTVDVIVAAKA